MNLVHQQSRRKGGFTLIEVLMVVVIILISTGIAAVSFSHSFKGMKLRLGSRAVVMAGRYARSMAVLHQTDTAVLFDSELATVQVVMLRTAKKSDEEMFLDATQEESPEDIGIEQKLSRKLKDVKMVSVSASDDSEVQEIDGIYWIMYYPNGQCDPYSVLLQDENGKSVTIDVDPLSGRAAVH
ncbi:MAG: prepilin-type N-terminal cleavage/methylation domain-containing protein [Spartobacteria bacterium]|nr:prepilin-type N-terminal cleavage/methylation domain-containing protein [Spartobacteria bacterium]